MLTKRRVLVARSKRGRVTARPSSRGIFLDPAPLSPKGQLDSGGTATKVACDATVLVSVSSPDRANRLPEAHKGSDIADDLACGVLPGALHG